MRLPEKFKIGETLKKDIGPKLNVLVDYVRSLAPHGDQKTIMVTHTDVGCFFSRAGRAGGGAGSGGSANEEPFTVVSSGDGLVKVLSYNAYEGRLWESLIILGLEKIAVTETEISASANSHVWIEIAQSGGQYAYEIKSGAFPVQTSALMAIPLAYVNSDNSITQMWRGNIVFPGRVF